MSAARTACAVFLSLCAAAPAAAQESAPPLPSRPVSLPVLMPDDGTPAERLRALRAWTQDYADWKAWYARWRNRREPGWFSTRERRQPPVPPAWLPAACRSLLEDEGPLVEACEAWREWALDDVYAEFLAQQVGQARSNQEAPRKSLWWEHVHVDALWPMTQSGASGFGVAGMHTTLHVTRRLQVFVAPGAILMRLPSVNGGQTWSAAADWGFSFSLFDFRMPGVRRPSTVHVNMARVWILGNDPRPATGELYLAGLSLTFKRR
jgi:hypothetical protein